MESKDGEKEAAKARIFSICLSACMSCLYLCGECFVLCCIPFDSHKNSFNMQQHVLSYYLNIVFNLRYLDFVHQMENSGQKSVL